MPNAASSRRRKWPGCSAKFPGVVERSADIAQRIGFDLSQLKYEYPDEPVPPGEQRHAAPVEDLTCEAGAPGGSARACGSQVNGDPGSRTGPDP